jgi:DNA mismatch repair protein MutS2
MTDDHALSLLEFARVREDVAGYCLSDEGREAVLEAKPGCETEDVSARKAATAAILALFQEGEEGPSPPFPPIAESARRLAKEGYSLEFEELYALGLWAESFAAIAAFLKRAGGPVVKAALGAPDLSAMPRVVFRVLNRDGSLRDLPELREARERIARTHRDIKAASDSFFKDPELRPMLQSGEPTIRDGRTVLALRASYKSRVKGIVHEVSATGQTVFVEPEELVQKNNELVQEEARYRQELARVARETSERLRPASVELPSARACLAFLDAAYARARHARVGGLVMARDLPEGFVLRRARHPLLGKKAVPIDVELPEGTRTLIVTGPNTGGKTVTLKTVGLLALMNQFGLGIPAAPESGFAVFDAVHADIGDEQSIDQSLSTFSGHMRVIGGIANRATAASLVLLDELGSGTDPEEGCAVAMSLLDHFIGRGCLTVLTTHHGILKNYGYSRPGCLNASMDFDSSSLSPTYRILMGVPGESRALEVASKNGLDPGIVAGARKYLAEERADVSELIRGLTEKHRRLEDLESDRRKRLREAMEAQRKADLGRLMVRQKELELRERGVSDLKKLLSEGRKTLENLVRELRESGLGVEKTKEVKEYLASLAGEVEAEYERLEALRLEARPVPPEGSGPLPVEGAEGGTAMVGTQTDVARFAEGGAVLVGSSRKPGTILRKAKKGYWVVETESLRLTLPESELAPAAEPPKLKTMVQVELAPRDERGRTRAVFELDLRGFRLAEAIDAVEKQIDAASLQALSFFSIIHGTGEGILGKGIHEYLRGHPAIADYHFARPEEGGYGKTVVRLK